MLRPPWAASPKVVSRRAWGPERLAARGFEASAETIQMFEGTKGGRAAHNSSTVAFVPVVRVREVNRVKSFR